MTVYVTNAPTVETWDHYKYDWLPGLKFPAAGVDFDYPTGTVEGDPIMIAMGVGAGTYLPTVTKRTSGDGISRFAGTSATGSSIHWWACVAGTELGFNARVQRTVPPYDYIESPLLVWVIRLDGSTNPPEDLTFGGPRYQYWNFSTAADAGRDAVTYPSTDYTFNPDPVESGDSPAFSGVPDGTYSVNGLWFQGLVLDTDLGGPYGTPFYPDGDVVPLPSTPSGWTLLDSDTYTSGSLVDTVAIYYKEAYAASVQFPSTTVDVAYHVGSGDLACFLDYDYVGGDGGGQGFDEWWDVLSGSASDALDTSAIVPVALPDLSDTDDAADAAAAGVTLGWTGSEWGPLDTLDGGGP